MKILLGEIPKHGDIVESGIDKRNRIYLEVFDIDLGIARRFVEDVRTNDRRERERDHAITN